MTEQSPAEAIFFAALEKATPEERAAYLDAACGDDKNLRQRVERLLAAHPHIGSFLEQPAQGPVGAAEAPTSPPAVKGPTGPRLSETTSYHGPSEGVGSVIASRYKLLETLGQGGMGAVFMAQQTAPVKRLVALKLIKLGMDSRQVLTRFDAERQALALMDHPNIAKVLDAGATDSGRPFFVMELVKGVPITRFCDERQLSPRERLELFIPVCQAIQHAHQKGIIHRDIKPTNVLVALYDDRPVPKVIDFGVAKAAGSQLTDASLVTGFGAIVGTPEYMSPEQAQLNQLDIDTRSDVYALGVLLYELLTGMTPIDRKRLGQDALFEILRVIREDEPPRPSTRLSTSEALASIAATRRTEPGKLTRLMRGELDWIVMKCLEKDRSRRYETASGLARDLERYLKDEVVEARPPSAGYRLRKVIRKHRVAIATASAFVALLIAAAGISALLAIKARRAEAAADIKRIEAEWNETLATHNLDLYHASLNENFKAIEEADARATGLQLDQDSEEIRSNPTVGLLRMARTLKMIPKNVTRTFSAKTDQLKLDQLIEQMEKTSQATGKSYTIYEPGASKVTVGNPRMDPLRQFATMALLATGQAHAPLLPTITHDGLPIRSALLSAKGDRLLTRGADKTARLWDALTGKQIALLRRADEKVIEAGLSPDGATAFTHSLDGVVRLWQTRDGAFRAETLRRPERIKFVGFDSSDPFEGTDQQYLSVTRLSIDRLLTWRVVRQKHRKEVNGQKETTTFSGPVELWDTRTGQFIIQLERGKSTRYDAMDFFGNGRWIQGLGFDEGDEDRVVVYSSENGRLLGKLNQCTNPWWVVSPTVSPSGGFVGTVTQRDAGYNLNCWDS